LIEDLLRIYPSAAAATDVREWKPAMPKFPPGRFREIGSFLARTRRPGLHFCGDYLIGPFIEAAVTTGQRSAEAILG
jgi:predicted NAD/FAD-dependent oxidoreductase